MAARRWNSRRAMISQLIQYVRQTLSAVRRRWPLWLALAVTGGWVGFAFMLSDEQGRMDLPQAYAVRMTCEDDPEAALWSGGCERVAADIAKVEKPAFGELYRAFVAVHHAGRPREAIAAPFATEAAEPGFDVAALLEGQRYGVGYVKPEFDGVRSRAHAEAVKDAIDARDRALLAIGRAGLGFDALIAGALANLAHPGAMIEGARKYALIVMGTAKKSDFATGLSARP